MVSNQSRILIMTAVVPEQEAVLRGLKSNTNIDVSLAGVGPVEASARTARILSTNKYDLVISAGIAGGFVGKAEVGTLVVSNEIVGADLGVETHAGFSSLDELGFGCTKIKVDTSVFERINQALNSVNLVVTTGPIITVSTATGTAASALELSRRVPGVIAEGMEGYGVALAAQIFGIPAIEIRAISNQVGPRDKSLWRIKEAFDILEKAFSRLSEDLLI